MENQEYEQVRTPDKRTIAAIVNDYKGPRTMVELSVATGLSTSMLSRMINGNYSKPFSLDILKKLYNGRREGSLRSFDELVRANGLRLKREVAISEKRRVMAERDLEARYREENVRNVIVSELYIRGVAIQNRRYTYTNTNNNTLFRKYDFVRMGDLCIHITDQGPDLEWRFFINTMTTNQLNPFCKTTSGSINLEITRVIRRASSCFLADAWEPTLLSNLKCSFVFVDKLYYENFIEIMADVPLHNRFSVILVNLDAGIVKEETMLKNSQYTNELSLFSLSIQKKLPEAKAEYDMRPFYDDVFKQKMLRYMTEMGATEEEIRHMGLIYDKEDIE